MIDIHSHIVPGIDDGARDVAISLEMARIAVGDGITHMVCTPHITPGIYDNDSDIILRKIADLKIVLAENEIPLELFNGADVHVSPDIAQKITARKVPTINNSRYFLLEPSHHVLSPNICQLVKNLMAEGFYPVLTHPERLSWIERHYDIIVELDNLGIIMQITAASLTGRFGKRPTYWSQRMLDEGRIDILATDAHNTSSRPPVLSKARDMVAHQFDENYANMMVFDRPSAILTNQDVVRNTRITQLPQKQHHSALKSLAGWFSKTGAKH